MRIVHAERDGCRVLALEGRLDRRVAPAVHRHLLTALADSQQPLVCDLGGLRVADPGALTLFHQLGVQAAYWPGTPVLLCRADPPTTDGLRRLGADMAVSLRTTVAAAVAEPHGPLPVIGDVLRLPPLPPAARAAREFVRNGCRGYSRETVETAVLLVNELVTHALRRPAGDLAVLLSLCGPAVRLAVADDDPRLPHRLPRPFDPQENLDLRLLNALAGTWGALPAGRGKIVWCLLED